MLHGGTIVARALASEGVDTIFTLPGASVQGIYDGCLDESIRVLDVRHEQTAGYAADAWGRVTGKPGVAVVDAAAGVTGIVSAFANASAVGSPMVVVGGAPGTRARKLGVRPVVDQIALTAPLVKWAATVDEASRLEEFVHTAFRTATSGVPGPVFLEVPVDVLSTFIAEDQLPKVSRPPTWHPPAADQEAIERAAKLLARAKRPVIVVGAQLRWSRDPEALGRMLERFAAPVFLDGMARGALSPAHRCSFSLARAEALAKADALLVVGKNATADLGPALDLGEGVKPQIVQIDLDPARIGHELEVSVGIASDAGLALTALGDALPEGVDGAWLESLREHEDELADAQRAAQRSSASPPTPLRVCAEIARYLDDDTILVGDGGDFVAAATASIRVRWPGMWLEPGPLRTLGVGPGFAIAAKLARPNAKVIAVLGDGAFGLHPMEWEVMARHDIRVVGVVGNDAGYAGMRRLSRERFGEGREVATDLTPVALERIADACGARGFSAETPEQLSRVLEHAFACERPALVNVKLGAPEKPKRDSDATGRESKPPRRPSKPPRPRRDSQH